MTRLHPAIALDDLSGALDRPRRRKGKKRRPLGWVRRQQAEERAERERRQARDRRRARDREPELEPVAGAVLPAPGDAWGPAVRMGRNLRVQAAVGHRAAVIELKPGLFLVAELPEQATRPEFGIIPFLAPMIVKAASDTITPIVQASQARKSAKEANAAQVRMVRAQAPAAPAHPAPLALPGPVAAPPATAGTIYLPAPNVGWADDALVAEVMGCDACDGGCRR